MISCHDTLSYTFFSKFTKASQPWEYALNCNSGLSGLFEKKISHRDQKNILKNSGRTKTAKILTS